MSERPSLVAARKRALARRLVTVDKSDPLDWYIEACIVCGCQLGPGIGSRTSTGRCVHEEHHGRGGTIVHVVSVEEYQEAEADLRREWWLHHGHDGLYGDDGEMQCGRCPADFKRQPLDELREVVFNARLARATEAASS